MCMACCYGVSAVGKVITKNLRPQTLDLFSYLQTGNSKTRNLFQLLYNRMGLRSIYILTIRHASNGLFHNTLCGASLRIT
jgi:hypothetical protein